MRYGGCRSPWWRRLVRKRDETQIEAAELQAVFEQRLLDAEQSCYTAEEKTFVKAVREHYSVYVNHVHERLRPQGLAERLIPQTAEKEKTIRLALRWPNPVANSWN